jgi:hypothetical protein
MAEVTVEDEDGNKKLEVFRKRDQEDGVTETRVNYDS